MNKFNILDDGLIINKISKTYGNKKVVRDISLKINRGEIVGLLGPNGAGKTTTFYIIVGLVKPDMGTIFLDKLEISNQRVENQGKKINDLKSELLEYENKSSQLTKEN